MDRDYYIYDVNLHENGTISIIKCYPQGPPQQQIPHIVIKEIYEYTPTTFDNVDLEGDWELISTQYGKHIPPSFIPEKILFNDEEAFIISINERYKQKHGKDIHN